MAPRWPRIRDEELYREAGFDGFVEYLESKPWGIDWRQSYRMIEASSVAALVPVGQTLNGRQAREVYAEVVESARPRESRTTSAQRVRLTPPIPPSR